MTKEELITFEPIYETFDLGQYDARFSGRTLKLLANPSRKFRKTFAQSSGDDWLMCLSVILSTDTPAQAEDLIDVLDIELYRWLLIGAMDDTVAVDQPGRFIPPHVYRWWDAWADARVKAHAKS